MSELYALYNVKSNKFLVTDRSYEMLKTIQFIFAHRILFYCVRVSDIRGYREGLLNKDRHKKLGLADHNRIGISTDIHPKSDDKIKFVGSNEPNAVHDKFTEQAEFMRDFLRMFNKEFGYFQDVTRTRSRTQKNSLNQLTEYAKLVMPNDEQFPKLIDFEIDHNFGAMKYLRVYKGEVIDILQKANLELEINELRRQTKENIKKIPVTCHPQRYITPKVLAWFDGELI